MKQLDLEKIRTLIKYFIIQHNVTNILLAISGGQDSLYLIKILETLKKQLFQIKTRISYLYIDHQWKPTSRKQVKHIINYIKLIKSRVIIYQIHNITLSEDECRTFRYHIILQHAAKYKFQLIITGHNATDTIETFIQNIIKGSGIESLNNLAIKSKIFQDTFILRPLLKLDRDIIYWICKKFYLPIWSDNTNYIYKIQRNRIRQELIPYIKKYLHKNIENNIKSLINNYYYQNEYIKQSVIKLYLKSRHNKRTAINHQKINTQNFMLQIKVIQLFCFDNFQIYLENAKVIKVIHKINKKSLNLSKIINYNNFIFFMNTNWFYLSIEI
uniref:tRNA(Ile)-lysidine synthase, chloroplastic n=1 Tax=Symphyocladiella dendroidea TaxID=2506487 RepID=A0A1Z1M6V5_9FLOR|nr:tRNA Ile-lysidine synthetase [Symphyocladiella dendroidea]ARW61818.1 tRNA Ile-lysidine synthetase [Symphyocladiella dendroidea]